MSPSWPATIYFYSLLFIFFILLLFLFFFPLPFILDSGNTLLCCTWNCSFPFQINDIKNKSMSKCWRRKWHGPPPSSQTACGERAQRCSLHIHPRPRHTRRLQREADAECVASAGGRQETDAATLTFLCSPLPHSCSSISSLWLIHCLHNAPASPQMQQHKQRGGNSFGHSDFSAAPHRKERVFAAP